MSFEIENGVLKKYTEEQGVTEVIIPESVTRIGDYAFYECTGLTSVTIPEGLTSIGEEAFYGCAGLTSVIIPDSVSSIGGQAFGGTKWIEDYPDDFIIAGNNILIEYKGNDKNLNIPESVTSIGEGVFSGCESLTSVIIPEGVTSIGGGAFYHCKNLTSVKIPEGVTSIGDGTFEGCKSLISVIIPDSVTSIGIWVFYGCPDLILTISGIIFSMKKIKENELKNACAMLKTRDFSAEMTDEIKYAFLVGDYLKTNHADAEAYIQKNFLNISRFLIDYDNPEAIARFIRMKKFFKQENTDKILQYAIEQEKHEITLMLTNHKEEMGWYDHPADKLKL